MNDPIYIDATAEIDPTAQQLIEQAAGDAYQDIINIPHAAAVTKTVIAGNCLFMVRVRRIETAKQESPA
jgi:hypothetical protein